jgi:hypothetical protein
LKTSRLTFSLISLISIGKIPKKDYINVFLVSTTESDALLDLVEVKGWRLAITIHLPSFDL